MRWPFRKPPVERRTYTDLRVEAAAAAVSGRVDVAAIGAAEACAGLWGRALAMATVTPARAAMVVDPMMLYDVGRDLLCRGEAVYMLEADAGMGGVVARRCSAWDVYGGVEWSYRCTMSNPSSTRTRRVPGASVLHFRLNSPALHPERGRSPWVLASLTAATAAGMERMLGAEASANHGYVVPAPLAGLSVEDSSALRDDLRTLKGRTAMVPGMEGFGDTRPGGTHANWVPRRLGMVGDKPLADLRSDAAQSIVAASGVPVELVTQHGDGTGRREAWRQFLHGTIAPVASILSAEMSAKLETPVSMGFDLLFASDIQGRGRAFQSLRAGGLSIADAAAATGVQITGDYPADPPPSRGM